MGEKAATQRSIWLGYSASSTRDTGGPCDTTPHTMTKARSARRHTAGRHVGPPHTSFTASQQASTMSTRHTQSWHTQSWHTHCQCTGTITWQSEYICPGTKGSEAALSCSSSLCPPHWAPTLFSEPVSACGRAGGSNYLLTRQNPLPFV